MTKEAGIKSFVMVPLIVKGEVFGVLTFHYMSKPIVFTEARIDFARKLAALLSLIIANIHLFEAEHEIAETLQEALLTMPDSLPGLAFGHLYRSASEASRVGGDFYELFELGHGKVGIVIGDVSGKGLGAAAMTSLVKNAIKSYAFEGMLPAEVMAKTNEIVTKTSPEAIFITVFFGILDTADGRLTYCSAGHPPAFIERRDGTVVELEVSASVVGIFSDSAFADTSLIIKPKERLVLYTDGITEARREGEFFGDEGLMRSIKKNALESVEKLPLAVFKDVSDYVGGVLSDDLALLVLSRT